jgi:subtilisin-like proprotein convertase family protein
MVSGHVGGKRCRTAHRTAHRAAHQSAHRGRRRPPAAVGHAVESLEQRTLLAVFANAAPIAIPSVGAASPYPSGISVSGLAGAITDVNVTLKGFSHTFPDDVDVLLVGPGGQKTILLSDAGEKVNPSGANITLDDEAASFAPDSGGIPSGTYKPTDYESGDTFSAPAPVGPYVHSLTVFDGTVANGAWSLYVMDDVSGDSGTFAGGWELNITTGAASDFGDAPAPYPTLLANNGARHTITAGVQLGAAVDSESDGQPGAGALLDDNTTSDDEDGVVFTSALVGGQSASVDVTASVSGFLNAWIDFNSDGDWSDGGEQIFVNTPLSAGVNSKSFAVPLTPPDLTYARFRFSTTAGGLSFTGAAADGEVEDYAFGKITGSKWNDFDNDGVQDANEPPLAGWTVYADWNNNSSLDAGEPTAVTDTSGNYTLTGLPARSYNVREVQHANWAQSFPAPATFGTPVVNVAGQGFTGVDPPDPVGDVGPNHYVQAVNSVSGTTIRIYNKSGGLAVAPFTLDTLATAATGGSAYSGAGDPVVVYDKIANRWLLTEFEETGNELDIFLSKTGTPTNNGADWLQYRFTATNFPDYAKITVWPDAYLIGTDEPDNPVYALNRPQMLAGGGGVITPIRRTTTDRPNWPTDHMMPVQFDGASLPPAGAAGMFIRQVDDELTNPGSANPVNDFLQIWELHPDFATPANTTYVLAQSIPIAEFSLVSLGLNDIPQPGTSTKLDGLDDVMMWRTQYRNFGTYQTLVGTFTVDDAATGAGQAGVRWFELRKSTGGGGGSWTLYQQGTVAPDSDFRWCGSIAMDGGGNIALAYNVSNGSSVYPGLRYIGRRATDPLGTMPRGEFVLTSGGGIEGTDRWGDYAAMTVDPADDSTFWYTGAYVPAGGTWATRVAALTLTPPVGSPGQNVTLAQGASAAGINFGNHFLGNGMWDAGGDGANWTDALNWSNNVLPSSSDDVVIDVPGVQTIQLISGTQSIRSLSSQENLTITGGSLSITQPSVVNGSLTVSGGGTLNLGNSLTAAGAVSVATGGQINLTASGTHLLDVNMLSVDAASRVDLANNRLIVRAGTVGSWNGSAYTGITGLVRSGRNGGSWNGPGIITSAASGNLTTLGVAEIGGDVVVKYTYGGDANLDGKINVDDYGHIDSSVVLPGVRGWFNGDFNYDGKINVDDYGIIDSNVPIQGPPLGTAPARETTATVSGSLPILSESVTSAVPLVHDRDVFDSIFSTADIL